MTLLPLALIFAYFVLGIVMNAISRSKPERYTMVPVSVVLAGLSFLIAMGYGELATATLVIGLVALAFLAGRVVGRIPSA